MNIDQVIAQLKAAAPIFSGNVAGAAGYSDGVDTQVWLPLPAAYVVPLDQDAEDNQDQTGLNQIVHERVGVIVVLDTMNIGGVFDIADRRGQAAANYLDAVKYAIFRAILNWRPDWNPATPETNRESRGMYFVAAGFPRDPGWDRARFFYQFVFGLDTTITDADGWVLQGVPLVGVQGTITDGPGGEQLAVVNASLGQTPAA